MSQPRGLWASCGAALGAIALLTASPNAAQLRANDSGLSVASEKQPPAPAPTDAAAGNAAAGDANAQSPVAELEQLLQSPVEVPAMQQEVTTVSGQESTVGKSPAAVFVITQEMIHRSGVTSVPEALRMAPGIQVARINSSQWAVTSRGFNFNIAGLLASNNKLLILIDGRTVFTPFYNGTYWDVQDLILADVERIEVIRGPGATIWGANAVNGVINIITKRAADTQGGLVQAGVGSEERGFTNARVGGQAGDDVHYRIYGRWFDRDSSFDPTGFEADDWRQGRGGFRVDWTPSECDTFTLQGDLYEGKSGFLNTVALPARGDDERVSGGDMLARWTRDLGAESDVSLQLYYDRADRANNIASFDQEFNTYDAELRHHFHLNDWHNVIWGLGYRVVRDRITALTPVIAFDPPARTYDTASFFVQDEITLTDAHFLTVGAKLQHNDFTGWEVQPTIRLLYSPENSWAAWAAVSRAVRTPSRIESDGTVFSGGIPFLDFVPTFDSEELIAYEIGYRSQPVTWFSWDIATFFNQYEKLSSLSLTPVTVLPVFNTNLNRGEGYGFELSSTVEMTSEWRVSGGYSFLELQIHPGVGTVDLGGTAGQLVEGSSPHNQIFLMSSHDLASNVDFDLMGRYVDNLPVQRIPSYIEMDARLAYRPGPNWEIALVGQNLLQPHHPEFATSPRYEIERGVYGSISHTW